MAPRSRTRYQARLPLPACGLRDAHNCLRAHLPSLLVGEDRLGRRPSAEGGRRAWSALSTKPSAVSAARGRGLTDRLPLAPAADVAAAYFDQEAYARRPLLARPSAESVLPTRGRRNAAG